MSRVGRLDRHAVIPVLEPLRRVNRLLLELLQGLDARDWQRPSVHPERDVKDLAAHLLHGSLRRVTALRDGYRRPGPATADLAGLIAFIQQDNREFMIGLRRVSPRIIVELIERYDRELVELFARLDPQADGLGVAWAGQKSSPNWFDVAREYTEKWHHQQQIRDATDREPLYQPELLDPVLETFARGLPFALRDVALPAGSRVAVRTTGRASRAWTLVREEGGWTLWRGADERAGTSVALPAEVAWRLWTRSMEPKEAREKISLQGEPAVAQALLSFVAIMA